MNNELGKCIKYNRLRLGYSQNELSRLTGVDSKTISLIERGIRRKPLPDTLIKLSEVLGCIDVRLLYLAGYTQNEISLMLNDFDDEYRYKFHVLITGYGTTHADEIDEAYDSAYEDIKDSVNLIDFKNEFGETFFNKDFAILIDFDKDGMNENEY